MPLWCESILGVHVEQVQGNQVLLEWTETFCAHWEWWHDPWSSSRLSCGERLLQMRQESLESFPEDAGKGTLISSYEEETGLLLMWAGPSGFLSSGGGYVGELLELQQGCEGPFGSSRGKV